VRKWHFVLPGSLVLVFSLLSTTMLIAQEPSWWGGAGGLAEYGSDFFGPSGPYRPTVLEVVEVAAAFIWQSPDLAERDGWQVTPLFVEDRGHAVGLVFEVPSSCCSAYVVATGDKRLPPVIAYSPVSAFPWERSHANALADMVEYDIQERLRALEDGTAPAEDVRKNLLHWERLRMLATMPPLRTLALGAPFGTILATNVSTQGGFSLRIGLQGTCALSASAPQGPWMTFDTWNQVGIYDDLCPRDTAETGEPRSRAGCVATAMAQIIYHWQYPASVFFPSTTYTWGLRVDGKLRHGTVHKSTASMTAIPYASLAECRKRLSFAAGVSVEMKYSYPLSVASLLDAAEALRVTWGYSSAEYSDNADGMLTVRIYESIARTSLSLGVVTIGSHPRPAIMGVPGKRIDTDTWIDDPHDELHAVVVDGFKAGPAGEDQVLYWINCGWGGTSDSYYSLPCGYPQNHNVVKAAVLKVHP